MPGGNVPEYGPALVEGALVLTGDIKLHVFIAFTSVGGEMVRHPERPFGEDIELHVRAVADDAPHRIAPGVGLLQKRVGGHVHPYPVTRRDLEITFPVPFHRLGEILGAEYLRGLSRNLVGFVQHEHIAVGTAFAVLSASVPRVPGLEVDHAKASWLISLLPS